VLSLLTLTNVRTPNALSHPLTPWEMILYYKQVMEPCDYRIYTGPVNAKTNGAEILSSSCSTSTMTTPLPVK